MVEYAWSLIVAAALELKHNNRVSVLSVSLVMLIEAIIGTESNDAYLPGLDRVQATTVLSNLEKAMAFNPCKFLLRRFHLAQKSTAAFVSLFDLSEMTSLPLFAAHCWIHPMLEWFHEVLTGLYRDEHRRNSLFSGPHRSHLRHSNIAPLGQFFQRTAADLRRSSDPLPPDYLVFDCPSDGKADGTEAKVEPSDQMARKIAENLANVRSINSSYCCSRFGPGQG